jgi:hypothetical protein
VQVPETQTGEGFDNTAVAVGIEIRLITRKRFTTKIRIFFISQV